MVYADIRKRKVRIHYIGKLFSNIVCADIKNVKSASVIFGKLFFMNIRCTLLNTVCVLFAVHHSNNCTTKVLGKLFSINIHCTSLNTVCVLFGVHHSNKRTTKVLGKLFSNIKMTYRKNGPRLTFIMENYFPIAKSVYYKKNLF